MPVSRSGNRIATTAIVAARGTAAHDAQPITTPEVSSQTRPITALCPAGMNHASNGRKPRMPRFGTEQMRYMRSRPWRSRGPWFDNRAGARRRGRRDDELEFAFSDELHDGVASTGVDVEAEDVLLASAPAWPISERLPAAWVAHDLASLFAPNEPGHDRVLQPIDQLAEAVMTGHMLSSLNDDSDTSSSSSRQSA
jgi:hypothetical protein